MNKKIDTGGPIYPGNDSLVDDCNDGLVKPQRGITFIDTMAALAMSSLLVRFTFLDGVTKGMMSFKDIAKASYEIAQAMLAEKRRLEGGSE